LQRKVIHGGHGGDITCRLSRLAESGPRLDTRRAISDVLAPHASGKRDNGLVRNCASFG
jgi:hypothetical protein